MYIYFFKCIYLRRFMSKPILTDRGNMFIPRPRTAYFKRVEESTICSLSVVFENENLNVRKNLTVNKSEKATIRELLQRLNLKIYTQLEKTRKKRLKKNPDLEDVPEVQSKFYCSGVEMTDDVPCEQLFGLQGNVNLIILGETYDVLFNVPWINAIRLPDVIISGTIVKPSKLEIIFSDRNNTVFKWFRSEERGRPNYEAPRDSWIHVGDGFNYNVSDDDVGHLLKLVCTPMNETTTGPDFVEISSCVVQKCDHHYYFMKTHQLTKERVGKDEIRVVTYNILADYYTTTKEGKVMFDYCPPHALHASQRMSAIYNELAGYNADVMCIQEIDGKAYGDDILPLFERLGISGVHSTKTSEDGIACLYNKEKFLFLGSKCIVYGSEISVNPLLSDIYNYLQQNSELFNKFSNLVHSLQLLALESVHHTNKILIVGNVHLYSQAEADIIRLLQVITSFILMKSFKEDLRQRFPDKKSSFILCGDFNSTPECEIYNLIKSGSISSDNPIWEKDIEIGKEGLSYNLPLDMDSAFDAPKFTNYTRSFQGCLDYIFYDKDGFEVSTLYPLPSEEELSANVAIPSVAFPSDHIPLIADLRWKSIT
ncbi:UNVERIFIED_CONTAM: hypothetical protein PYX00_006360 [Menopon gallinae]|uniref:2',5'-phosphodiesterase 12 n=1 Tax=Menopon gallinae TaxID=328185 RepID=A0AAW2HV28_9NEOP